MLTSVTVWGRLFYMSETNTAPAETRFVGKCRRCKTFHKVEGVLVKDFHCKNKAMCGTHQADLWKGKWVVTVECTCIDRTTNRRTLVQLAKVFAAFESTHECGARCINATGPSCECACRGKNHGRHS